ncbi:MAG: hypothetical protein QOD08_1935 [Gaiellaceae bacterium]|nr:hypothetical protein [Gaiellaceae bacterium]
MSEPQLSVVLLTPDWYETVRKTVESLNVQTVRDRLELVVVAPSAGTIAEGEAQLSDFPHVRRVALGEITSTAKARAAGVREATAPIVAFAEDHSFPEPGWAEALIRAHGDGWSAVGPNVVNANPDRMVGWADAFLGQRKVDPERGEVVGDLPGRNSSYRRDLLLGYGPELDELLEMETLLHWDLRAKGYELYLEPAARTTHFNHDQLPGFVREHFYVGRLFAGQRARRWSVGRRLAYAGAAPLIPLVRLSRILPEVRRSARKYGLLPGVLPPLLLGLLVGATGELLGYAAGVGSSRRRIVDVEFHRDHS